MSKKPRPIFVTSRGLIYLLIFLGCLGLLGGSLHCSISQLINFLSLIKNLIKLQPLRIH
jgi:hypothetical protein